MNKVQKPRRKSARQADATFFRSIYLMELARGSSHIASTLTPLTQRDAIAEVLREFRIQHDEYKSSIFRDLLAEALEKRAQPLAAQAVLAFDCRPAVCTAAGA